MSTANQALRKPQFVVEKIIETVVDASAYAVGDNAIGLSVPADKFVTGAFLSNPANDLAGGTDATVAVKVGSTTLISATALASVKNLGVSAEDASPDYSASARSVYVTVGTANLTAGTLVVKVAYI